LILRKIIDIFATRCHIFKLKCTKFDFGKRKKGEGEGRGQGEGREGERDRGRTPLEQGHQLPKAGPVVTLYLVKLGTSEMTGIS